MPKSASLVIKIATIVVAAYFITSLTASIPNLYKPTIDEPTMACSLNSLDPPPTRAKGIPLAYITHYTGSPTCGYTETRSLPLFVIDVTLWAALLLGLWQVVVLLRRR